MEVKEEIKKILEEKQCSDIVTLDFRGLSPFLDYFLIGTVRNARMAKAVIDSVEEYCNINSIPVLSVNDNSESKWFLIDIGSLVVHIFFDGEREKYDLEGLWKDRIEK